MTQKVRTRFAPSPTGMLHIGGVRTALFNYLYARATGGEYTVRIEDTDKERSTEENKHIIIEALNWLGLTPDNGEYVLQTDSLERHKQDVQKLLDEGKAYHCFCSKEELEAMRAEQEAAGQATKYDGRHRNLTDNEKEAFLSEGRTPVVRLKVEQEGSTEWDDLVQGHISMPNNLLDDFIILRSDGMPTYNFVVACDDHDMEITHVIRGDDHMNNTPKQIAVYKALGYDIPKFAHVPMIHGKNGKMSKRDGATNVLDYRNNGYLPEAVNNYLMRLGWSLGDEEIIPMATAEEKFDINNVGKGASKFDQQKLDWVNAQYIKNGESPALLQAIKPLYKDAGLELTSQVELYLLNGGLKSIQNKAKKLGDLVSASTFFFHQPPFAFGEKETEILANEQNLKNIEAFAQKLEGFVGDITHDDVSAIITQLCEETGQKFKDYGMPIRTKLAGTTQAPGIGDLVEIFGKDESVKRLIA